MKQTPPHTDTRVSVSWHDCTVDCLACVKICPEDALGTSGGKAEVLENCSGCGLCESACPLGAVQLSATYSVREAVLRLADMATRSESFSVLFGDTSQENDDISTVSLPDTPELRVFCDAMDLVDPIHVDVSSMQSLQKWAHTVSGRKDMTLREILAAEPAAEPLQLNGSYGKLHLASLWVEDDCTLCGACVSACPSHALRFVAAGESSLGLAFVNYRCFGCGDCRRVCPEQVIQFGRELLLSPEARLVYQGRDHACPECGQSFDVEETVREVAAMLVAAGDDKAAQAIQLCSSCRGQHYQSL